MYKCRECGYVFEEPNRWKERHGFAYGPFEEWSACPNCLSPDYGDEFLVLQEILAEEELED